MEVIDGLERGFLGCGVAAHELLSLLTPGRALHALRAIRIHKGVCIARILESIATLQLETFNKRLHESVRARGLGHLVCIQCTVEIDEAGNSIGDSVVTGFFIDLRLEVAIDDGAGQHVLVHIASVRQTFNVDNRELAFLLVLDVDVLMPV